MPENTADSNADFVSPAAPNGGSPRFPVVIAIVVFTVFVLTWLFTTLLGGLGSNGGDSVSQDDVRRIVEEVVGTQIAALPAGSGNASSQQVQQLIDSAVGTAVATLIPTATPIPPTPTVIPRGVAEGNAPFRGAADAPVVIIEFADFQCTYCGRWYEQTLPTILETYPDQVKFVYRHFPIFGDDSVRAAMAADCANDQGKFWEMHDRLFTRLENQEQAPLSEDTLVSYAQELGLDTSSFSQCLSSQKYLDSVISDYQTAQSYGLQGTPGFVIDGVVYKMGAQPFTVFDGIIKSELAKAGAS
jgi:protein-disulfide isomerase